jgi:transposase InsO family protein
MRADAQFTSWAFSQNVRDADLAPSMGAVGNPYDNAMVEAFRTACRSNCSIDTAEDPHIT